MKFLILLIIPFIFLSCTPTKFSFNEYISPEYNKEIIRTISIMEILGDDLTEAEKVFVIEKFMYEIKSRYKDVAFYDANKYLKDLNPDFQNNLWIPFWEKFIKTDTADPITLFDVSEVIKSNALLQIAIVEVDKIFGEHRKTIGETTVKLKLGLFSLKSGKLLWKADVSGTQANAHSDQVVPKVVEAVNVGITNVIDKLPFK